MTEGVKNNDLGSQMTGAMASWFRDGFDLQQLVRHELLLFAAFWFIVAAADELVVDARWFWLLITGRGRSRRLPAGVESMELAGRAAVIVPAWREAEVIGAMILYTLRSWSQRDFRLYVGCYCNDEATLAAAIDAAGGNPRIRIVVHDGQVRVDRAITRIGKAELRAGAGAWGGAQEGASRLDIGPAAIVGVPVNDAASARLAFDWRFRVTGNAVPQSGPELTLSAGFWRASFPRRSC